MADDKYLEELNQLTPGREWTAFHNTYVREESPYVQVVFIDGLWCAWVDGYHHTRSEKTPVQAVNRLFKDIESYALMLLEATTGGDTTDSEVIAKALDMAVRHMVNPVVAYLVGEDRDNLINEALHYWLTKARGA